MITSKNWQSRMSEDMRLRDYRPKTQQAYELVVRQFLRWVEREPETLTEEHVRAYVLHLREEKQQAPSSINIAVCGLRFFFSHTLPRDWPVFELMRMKRFLQHTPTKGLHRVRAFGLLHSVHRATLRRVQLSLGYTPSAADADEAEKKCRAPRCPYCKQQTLRRVQRLSAKQCIVHVVRLAKADPIARAPPVAARGAA